MSAARLRDAARVIRERAEAAGKSWHPWSDKRLPQRSSMAEWSDDMRGYLGGEWGDHAATWHPLVALAVADWLDLAGSDEFAYGPTCDTPCPECDDDIHAPHIRHAIALADLILGEEASNGE